MIEEWRAIVGYEDTYECSSLGRIRNSKTNKILATHATGAGYKTDNHYVKASLWKNGKMKNLSVHRIVATAFLDNAKEQVNHINGIKQDNRLENLEWASQRENRNHSSYVLGNLIKPVIRIGKDGEEIKYQSIESTQHNGFQASHVYDCCYGKRKTHGNFKWKFENPSHADGRKQVQ